jgi:hypothetical protein
MEHSLEIVSYGLSNRIETILTILKYKNKVSKENFENLKCHFSSNVESLNNEIGWEDTTYIAITRLLKTNLAKNQKEANAMISSILKPLTDISKLKKHI